MTRQCAFAKTEGRGEHVRVPKTDAPTSPTFLTSEDPVARERQNKLALLQLPGFLVESSVTFLDFLWGLEAGR